MFKCMLCMSVTKIIPKFLNSQVLITVIFIRNTKITNINGYYLTECLLCARYLMSLSLIYKWRQPKPQGSGRLSNL